MTKIIKNQYDQIGFLGKPATEPDNAWKAYQTIKPLPTNKWFKFYPLTGGVGLAQEGTFVEVREATEADVAHAQITKTGFVNPAINSIKELMEN